MEAANELPATTATAAVTEKTNRRRLMHRAVYGVIALVAYLLITLIVKTPLYTGRDVHVYLNLADGIRQNGFFSFYDDVRTYGYPLFVALIQQVAATIAPTADPLNIIVQVQFVIHTGAALLAVALLDKIGEQKSSFRLRIVCFALVELNAVLLGLTRDLLTDSITVFLVMLFLWLLLSTVRFKWVLVGLVVALCIVVRPFNQVWSLAFLCMGGLLLFARKKALADTSNVFNPLRQMNAKRLLSIALQAAAPILIIVGLQYYFIYRTEQHISLTGTLASQHAAQHLYESVYLYKYETYVDSSLESKSVLYVFNDALQNIEAVKNTQGHLNIFKYFVTYPLATLYAFMIKTVGTFQAFEWSTYRITLINQPNPVYAWGFVGWLGLVYSHWYILKEARNILARAQAAFNALILLVAADLYLILYVVFTVPETRFMAPILPALTASGLVAASNQRRFTSIALAVLAFGVYMLTFQILRVSLT